MEQSVGFTNLLKNAVYFTKTLFFANFLRVLLFFMLFLERNREFSSCSLSEISTVSLNENMANAQKNFLSRRIRRSIMFNSQRMEAANEEAFVIVLSNSVDCCMFR